MIKLDKLIENRTREGEMTPCEKILGDLSRVYRMADFWDVNSDLIELVGAHELLEFASMGNFTSDEFTVFRLGLNKLGTFMSNCAKERKHIENLKTSE